LTATKMDKMFAKPFIGALDGHADGVFCTATR
jgi:DDB1- and CUL4-associated factor 13